MTAATKLCSLDEEDLTALAAQPLRKLCDEHLLLEAPVDIVTGSLPFDLGQHPAMKHAVARKMVERLAKEVGHYAEVRNAEPIPRLKKLNLEAIVAGAPDAQETALAQVKAVFSGLAAIKSRDEDFVHLAIQKLNMAVDSVGSNLDFTSTNATSEAGHSEKLRFWLLRYAGHEARVWFQLLTRSLLSPGSTEDFRRFNPFLSEEDVADILSVLSQMMLATSRWTQACRAMDHCRDLLGLLSQGGGDMMQRSDVALRAGLQEKSNLLCRTLASQRTYVVSDANGQLSFDPRFLVFEFISSLLLRPRQVGIVGEFLDTIAGNRSAVKQMIMGQGKTTVVTPLLALVLADTERIVCIVVPQALLEFSRSVLRSAFASVVQKQISTFKCDRAVDIDFNFSSHVQAVRAEGNVLLSTPGDVKSLLLRFLEQLEIACDRRAKRNTPQLRRETLEMGRVIELLQQQSVCMIDEVDMVLHPLKSELNFPTGPKSLIHHAPARWCLPLHVLDGFFAVEDTSHVPAQLKESHAAHKILEQLRIVIRSGVERKLLQKNPHLVLLNEDFYHNEMKPILCQWLGLWLTSEHVGRVFEMGYTVTDRGLSEDEISAYLLRRSGLTEMKLSGMKSEWSEWAEEAPWLLEALFGSSKEAEIQHMGFFDPQQIPKERRGFAAPTEYTATLEAKDQVFCVMLRETEAGLSKRMARIERLPAKDIQSLNLGADWLATFLPHCLQKIDRVTHLCVCLLFIRVCYFC